MKSVYSKIRYLGLDLIILRYFHYPFNYVEDVVSKHVKRETLFMRSNIKDIICNELEMYDENI